MDKMCLVDTVWILALTAFWIADSFPVRCTWRSSVSATLPETQTVAPLSECADGELYWNNPRGILTATFTKDGAIKDFTLCVLVASGNETLAAIYDVSTGIPIPLENALINTGPACVRSVREQVVIRLDATEALETLAVMQYFKQPP